MDILKSHDKEFSDNYGTVKALRNALQSAFVYI